jgi:hypothetical protein
LFDNSNPNEGNSTMPSFKDCEGRSWDLRIDVDVIRRVRTAHSIDLATALASPETIDRLTSDIVLTIDVIYEICRPVAEKIGVTAELFGRSLAGDALGLAVTAFEEALVDKVEDKIIYIYVLRQHSVDHSSLQQLVCLVIFICCLSSSCGDTVQSRYPEAPQ